MDNISKKKIFIGAIVLIIVTALLTVSITMQVVSIFNIDLTKSTDNGELYEKKFSKIQDILKNRFYEEIDDKILLQGALMGMADIVDDDYTYYMDAQEFTEHQESSEGRYAGIGVRVTIDKDGLIMVVQVFPDTPAFERGLRKYDKLLTVNDVPVSEDNYDECISMVRGEAGTEVNIKILRNEEEVDLTLIRAEIETPDVEYQMLDNNIGYVRFYIFDSNAGQHLIQTIEYLKLEGMQGLVLDIRGNVGGLLTTCLEVSDYFLPEGEILTIKYRDREDEVYKSDAKNSFDMPLVLITNGYTASAAEVLTGSVRDHGIGVLVGEKTFGKGIVQSYHNFEDGSSLKFTSAKYYLPNGDYIHGEGIEPDVFVEMGEDADEYYATVGDVPLEADDQLQMALREMEKLFQKQAN